MSKFGLLLALLLPVPGNSQGLPDLGLKAPVLVNETGFKAKLEQGQVITSWRRYRRDDFKSYHIIKSASTGDPVYPDTAAIFSSGTLADTEFADGELAPGKWYYRLCILSPVGDRWVSPAIQIDVPDSKIARPPPTFNDFEW